MTAAAGSDSLASTQQGTPGMYPWRSGIDAPPSGRWQIELTLSITDVDELLKNFPAINERFGSSDSRFATKVLGIVQLPHSFS